MSTSSTSKFFAVRKGNTTGVFDSWDECKKQIAGTEGADFAGFEDEGEAFAWLNKCGKYAPKAESSTPTRGSYSVAAPTAPSKPRGKSVSKSKVEGGAKKQVGKSFRPKFYAVSHGHVVGVFNRYGDIAESISFYPKPHFKSFFSKAEAQEWIDEMQSKEPLTSRADVEEHAKSVKAGEGPFWAVASGYATGVFDHVQTCVNLTKGVENAHWNKFDNYEDAVTFVSENK